MEKGAEAAQSSSHLSKKIVSFDEFKDQVIIRHPFKKIIQCHGVFDLLHIGHVKHLEEAKRFGDILVVTLTPDRYVNKGPGRPVFTENLRAESIAALGFVDYVIINDAPTAVEAIQKIKPSFYIKGIEYKNINNDLTGKINDEEKAVNLVGGSIKFTDDIVFSSSSLLNRFFSPFSPEVISYLDKIKSKYDTNNILSYLTSAKNLKVLLIGEAIIDIYHYVEAIGKAGKEPVLVTKYCREEIYAGGVLAVANHLADFCLEVTCITMLGENGEYEDFIRTKAKPNVNLVFKYKKNSPSIVKKRFLDEYSLQKLFEIYEINDSYLDSDQSQELVSSIEKEIIKNDLVVVADYGHGLLDGSCVQVIENKSKFLAVNTQSNAGNHGFNCISKYKKADYVCIATRELQLNYRQKHTSTLNQLEQLVLDYQYNNIVVTHGRKGSLVYKSGEGIYNVPAFATEIKDRIGAGDAVLAITSLCMVQNAPAELVGFIGNVVGAEAVTIMGNESSINKVSLMKHISHLLK